MQCWISETKYCIYFPLEFAWKKWRVGFYCGISTDIRTWKGLIRMWNYQILAYIVQLIRKSKKRLWKHFFSFYTSSGSSCIHVGISYVLEFYGLRIMIYFIFACVIEIVTGLKYFLIKSRLLNHTSQPASLFKWINFYSMCRIQLSKYVVHFQKI